MDILDTSIESFDKSIDDVLTLDQNIPEISRTADEVPEDQPGLLSEQSESEEGLTSSDKIWQLPCNGKSTHCNMARKYLLLSFIVLFLCNFSAPVFEISLH